VWQLQASPQGAQFSMQLYTSSGAHSSTAGFGHPANTAIGGLRGVGGEGPVDEEVMQLLNLLPDRCVGCCCCCAFVGAGALLPPHSSAVLRGGSAGRLS
jgi:hypothetical protein